MSSRVTLGKDAPKNLSRHLPIHHPKSQANAIPAEVPQTTKRLESVIGSNIGSEKLRLSAKSESRRDTPHCADAFAIIKYFAQFKKAATVHEHHTIHKLHALPSAGIKHFIEVGHADGTGLFTKDMF